MNSAPEWLSTVTGVLVMIVGFLFHWCGQLISILDWKLATRLGLQEEAMLPEHKVYEHGTAVADVLIGWVYGAAGIGLLIGADWGFKLAWIPGSILVYHALSFWFWEENRRKQGTPFFGNVGRLIWFLANFVTGILCLYLAGAFE